MMESLKLTKELPEGYRLRKVLNLSNNIKLIIFLNFASLAVMIGSGLFFIWLLRTIRPGLTDLGANLRIPGADWESTWAPILVFFGVILVMLLAHEGIHGLFFWLYTGDRPQFGFKGIYAYAAAPDWYLPRTQYLVVSLAPLLIITNIGFGLLLVVPPDWILSLLLLITLNASGAVGDLYVFFWVLTQPNTVLIQDFGDGARVYAPGGSGRRN